MQGRCSHRESLLSCTISWPPSPCPAEPAGSPSLWPVQSHSRPVQTPAPPSCECAEGPSQLFHTAEWSDIHINTSICRIISFMKQQLIKMLFPAQYGYTCEHVKFIYNSMWQIRLVCDLQDSNLQVQMNIKLCVHGWVLPLEWTLKTSCRRALDCSVLECPDYWSDLIVDLHTEKNKKEN